MPKDPSFHEVSVYIEQEEKNKFKIQSGQLEQIGEQLRGRREFSIFHSILLPLIVSVATIIFSSAFQYVSWFNSVGVKDATDIAEKAERTYDNSAAAIGQRHYAMLVFLPSLRDLVHAKADAAQARAQANTAPSAGVKSNRALSARAQVKGIKRELVNLQPDTKKQNPESERSPLSAITQNAEELRTTEISLHKSVLDVRQKRFAAYYEQLKLWNENYDHFLSEIEYALDRPIFEQAGKTNEDFRIYGGKIGQIDCSNFAVTEELQKQQLNSHSLKVRFAAIRNCFMEANSALDDRLTEGVSKAEPTFEKQTESEIKRKLDVLLAMANEFHCYAHRRIDYYNSQKEQAIFSTTYVWRWLIDATKTGALKHFDDAAIKCNPQKRSI